MLISLNETIKLIESGKTLTIAGDESLLERLPKGSWIGGTTPYFICNQGGIVTGEKLFVQELDWAKSFKISVYGAESVMRVADDAFPNGVSFLIVPFSSEAAVAYAKQSPYDTQLLMTPVVGWISGFNLDTESAAYVYDGSTCARYDDRAVALHAELEPGQMASIGIINIFEADENSPEISFPQDALEVVDCLVDGQKRNFSEYLATSGVNTQMPLVADCNSVLINVSIKAVEGGEVSLYAPVFAGEKYRFAKPVADYEASFLRQVEGFKDRKLIFSCNCILNFLYGGLKGKATPPFEGPVTFGEIAYQLVNQTLVYVELLGA